MRNNVKLIVGICLIIAFSMTGCAPSLHDAIKAGSYRAEELIEAGADINTKDENGNTPLLFAIMMNACDIAELLIEKGADVNDKDNEGMTPLHRAVKSTRCSQKIAEKLIEKGADVNAIYGESVLGAAIENIYNSRMSDGNFGAVTGRNRISDYEISLIRFLIAKGADVNIGNPLRSTVRTGDMRTAKLLIENGADVKKVGWNALIGIRKKSQDGVELERMLCERGIEVPKNAVLFRDSSDSFRMKLDDKEIRHSPLNEITDGQHNITISYFILEPGEAYSNKYCWYTWRGEQQCRTYFVSIPDRMYEWGPIQLSIDAKPGHIYAVRYTAPLKDEKNWSVWVDDISCEGH